MGQPRRQRKQRRRSSSSIGGIVAKGRKSFCSGSERNKTNMRISMFTLCAGNININLPRIKDAKHLRTTPMMTMMTQTTQNKRNRRRHMTMIMIIFPDDHAHWCRRRSRHTHTHTQQDKDEKKEQDPKADKVSTGPAISLSELGLGFGSGSLTGSYTDLLPYALQSKQQGVFQKVHSHDRVHRLPPRQSLFCLILQTWFQFLVLKFSGKSVWPTQLSVGYRAC